MAVWRYGGIRKKIGGRVSKKRTITLWHKKDFAVLLGLTSETGQSIRGENRLSLKAELGSNDQKHAGHWEETQGQDGSMVFL